MKLGEFCRSAAEFGRPTNSTAQTGDGLVLGNLLYNVSILLNSGSAAGSLLSLPGCEPTLTRLASRRAVEWVR
jgi:hypothetical protein